MSNILFYFPRGDRFHFTWIRDINILTKTSSSNPTKFCINCFNNFGNLIDIIYFSSNNFSYVQLESIETRTTRLIWINVSKTLPAFSLLHQTINWSLMDGSTHRRHPLSSMAILKLFYKKLSQHHLHHHLQTLFSTMPRRTSPLVLKMRNIYF